MLDLKIHTFVFLPSCELCQILLWSMNTALALPSLALMPCSVPPVVLTVAPKLTNLSTTFMLISQFKGVLQRNFTPLVILTLEL